MKRIAVLFLLAVVGCGEGEGIVSVISPTSGPSVAGTWTGEFTSSGTLLQGTMRLTQTGTSVSGTLTTSNGRSANVTGTFTGVRLSATFAYTDGCFGGASTEADLVQNPTRLIGTYISNDGCFGTTSGDYFLDRQ